MLINKTLWLGKFHRGKPVEGVWVFGGTERDSGRFFMGPVPDRTKETLLEFIKNWIEPGTIIFSDCWKPYEDIMYVKM